MILKVMLLMTQKFIFDPYMVNQGDVNLGTFRDDPPNFTSNIKQV